MANFLLTNVFRIAVSTLNFVSPSIVADIILHPFDFATVLLQIGFDPEGIKCETATFISVIVQYALFTFYIPYLLTSMQGLQFMGMPHPSIFYYVSYVYKKEGFAGCYRGLMPKICERLIMVSVNEKIKEKIYKDSVRNSEGLEGEEDQDKFIQTLINSSCSQFFAVLASHPFHVLMVSSFAEFTYNKNSSLVELSNAIYADEGYLGFFTGLTARLLGELLSLIFSLTYTSIINKQLTPQRPVVARAPSPPPEPRTAIHVVNYITDASRFTAFKQQKSVTDLLEVSNEEVEHVEPTIENGRRFQMYITFSNFLKKFSIRRNHFLDTGASEPSTNRRFFPILEYIPLTSKLFYYIMIRDFLSKKISNPFFLVCHNAIVLDTGWDKFPYFIYLNPVVNLIQSYLIPIKKKKKVVFLKLKKNTNGCCGFF